MLGYYLPLLVMVGAYMKILHVVKKRAASIRDAGKKEVPTVRILYLISYLGSDRLM